jgi:2-polyprenyl-6-methoxyphenol hydroxylase-like FAD-dependent oxidoreductase
MIPGAAGDVNPGGRRYSWGWYRGSSKPALADIFTDGGPRSAYSLPPGRMSENRVNQFQEDASIALPPQFAALTRAGSKPWIQGIFDYLPNKIVGHRVVLVGDAAALARPHVGLGTSKAAGDAVALAEALHAHASIAEALCTYERERLPYARGLVQRSIEIGTALRLA